MIAALYVETDGAYFGLPGVDPWDQPRDARTYDGPHRIVAHPPCQRWGRFWHGSTRKPHQFRLGADAGCFAAALTAVRNWGGGSGASRRVAGVGIFRTDAAASIGGLGHG